jgi:hypothetical protein
MSLERLDHVALEVADVDVFVQLLGDAGALQLIRRGVTRSGQRIAMLGDGTGVKIELIENAQVLSPRLAHLAFRSTDVDADDAALQASGWQSLRPPTELGAAKARTALLQVAGLETQILRYDASSPDVQEWGTGTQADATPVPNPDSVERKPK